jgi:acetyl esterase/lipase
MMTQAESQPMKIPLSHSFRSKLLKFFLRASISFIRRDDWTVRQRRDAVERFSRYLKLPAKITCEKLAIDHIPAEWIYSPETRPNRTILYLHGGAYVMCSIKSHRHLMAKLAKAADARILAIDYRLAPEHPYPAALEDAAHAYNWLLTNGTSPENLAVVGDSAGGGLAICTLVKLRDASLPLPAAAVCLSPWVDLTVSGESMKTKAREEFIIPVKLIGQAVDAYLNGSDPKTPTVSPIFADLSGLPPLLIQIGTNDVLLDDAKRLAARAEADGVEVTLETWEGMIHVWQFFSPFMPEAHQAIEKIGRFLKKQLQQKDKPYTLRKPPFKK